MRQDYRVDDGKIIEEEVIAQLLAMEQSLYKKL